MGHWDWLNVGLKLLGVYFGVTSVCELLTVWVRVAAAVLEGATLDLGAVFGLVMRQVYFLVGAYLLIACTDFCLRVCGKKPAPPSPNASCEGGVARSPDLSPT